MAKSSFFKTILSSSKLPSMATQSLYLFSLTLLSLLYLAKPFVPTNQFLLNCGSHANASLFNRVFVYDSANPSSVSHSADRSVSVTDRNPSPNSPILYRTARVFTAESSYKFIVKKNGTGTHFVRLHFSPFRARNFDLGSAKFNVVANGFLLFI
ncbi:hypothetical protein ES288_D12G298800v1 [Gossypium darwinii]|uniref:Malectin domain-containing protein n=1 Tax=Gossypium darwinii TaxID=34276 RepID=A0A5D2AF28_GOSDA|nr:hypothetical protein ES288_D12G298800v1 [Gossypium darwinii]